MINDLERPRQPLISLALPVFNSGKTIYLSIRSIVEQSYSNWELLIMDDRSSDDTLKIAESFHDQRIRIVPAHQHLGLAAQLNRAVELSRGQYLARMDGDDIAFPNRLLKQVRFLEDHPEVDLLSTAVVVFRSDGAAIGGRWSPLSHSELCAHPWAGIRMFHPTWMGRMEWFRKNPYRLDALRMEDRELLFRTHRNSCFAALPEVLLGYREDDLSLGKILFARRNTCKAMIRHAMESHDLLTAMLTVICECVKAVRDTLALTTGLGYRLLRNRARPISQEEESAWNRVWKQMSSVCDQEREVQTI
jgi:glycosyltransferase involved in cell wall biosynthesis